MKFPILLLVPSLFLAACASTQELAPAASDAQASEENPLSRRFDTELIQRYETAARRGGVKVYWVNLPRRGEDDNP